MQLIPVLLMAIVLASDLGVRSLRAWTAPSWWMSLCCALGPVVLIVLWIWIAGLLAQRRLRAGDVRGGWNGLERREQWARWLLVLHHAIIILGLGWLEVIRGVVGDLILVDEVLAITPALIGLVSIWFLHYPMERVQREAPLVRTLDTGRPVFAIPSRMAYVWVQIRLHILLLLVPLLLIVGMSELISIIIERTGVDQYGQWVNETASLAGVALVFLFAPLLARIVLSVEPLGEGEIRDDLLDVCRAHGVRVRNLLVWRTGGAMINAAVMGLIGPLRYVLLTDGLLEQLPREQVLAVMAHEIGHVRRHHLPWMILVMLAVMGVAAVLVAGGLAVLDTLPLEWTESTLLLVDLGAITAAFSIAMFAFGWVSRRFERQADTFAAQHMSGVVGGAGGSGGSDGPGVRANGAGGESDDSARKISAAAVFSIAGALGSIALMNAVDPERPNWRHGSIRWRQAYLHSIIGRSGDGLSIDRLVRRLKIVAMIIVIALVGLQIGAMMVGGGRSPSASERVPGVSGVTTGDDSE
jgi:Zn-dependent protease with chaperone function